MRRPKAATQPQQPPPVATTESAPDRTADQPEDPSWTLTEDQLEVQWTTHSAFQESWDRGLSQGTLTLPEGLLSPSNPRLRLRLSLPDGQLLVMRGSFTPPSTASFEMTMPLRHKLKTAMGG